MSKIKEFLSQLDDYELAFFLEYKLSTYLSKTQNEINLYIFKRHLTKQNIKELIEQNPKSKLNDDKERCPRCYSDKIRKDNVLWTETADSKISMWDSVGGKVVYKDEVICNVCGFWLEDPNKEKNRTLIQKISKMLSTIFTK